MRDSAHDFRHPFGAHRISCRRLLALHQETFLSRAISEDHDVRAVVIALRRLFRGITGNRVIEPRHQVLEGFAIHPIHIGNAIAVLISISGRRLRSHIYKKRTGQLLAGLFFGDFRRKYDALA